MFCSQPLGRHLLELIICCCCFFFLLIRRIDIVSEYECEWVHAEDLLEAHLNPICCYDLTSMSASIQVRPYECDMKIKKNVQEKTRYLFFLLLFRSKNFIVIAWAGNNKASSVCYLSLSDTILWSSLKLKCNVVPQVQMHIHVLLSIGFNLFHVIRRSVQTREFIHYLW